MRVVLFSDVHAIDSALFALEAETQNANVDAYWCLGDVVGYGRFPEATLGKMRSIAARSDHNIILRGNHDDAVACWGTESQAAVAAQFQPDVIPIIEKHYQQLSQADRDWLAALPLWAEDQGCWLVHGSCSSDALAMLWVYGTETLMSASSSLHAARMMGEQIQRPVYIVAHGHHHVPRLLRWNSRKEKLQIFDVWSNGGIHYFDDLDDCPLVINVGSLSLPRETAAQNTACYVLMEIDQNRVTLEFRALSYNYCSLLPLLASSKVDERIKSQLALVRLPPDISC